MHRGNVADRRVYIFFRKRGFAILSSSTLLSYVPGSCPWNVRSYLQKCRGKSPVSRRTNSREVRSRKPDEMKFDDLYIDDTIHRQRHNATAIRRPSWLHSDSKSIRCTSMCQYADQTCLIIDSCAEAKWSKQGGRVTKGRDSVGSRNCLGNRMCSMKTDTS